jgi:L-lactate permease
MDIKFNCAHSDYLFFLALAVFRLKGSVAGTITVVLALLVSLFAYDMPALMALASMVLRFLLWFMADRMDHYWCGVPV